MKIDTISTDAPDSEPLGLDDSPAESPLAPAKDTDGVPYCRTHHCRMRQASGGSRRSPKVYYACPVEGCEAREQKIKTRHENVVPQNPQACPRCSRAKKPVYCERDKDSSTATRVVLKCPGCGWKSGAMPVPQLAAAHFASRETRQQSEHGSNLGDR